MGWLQGGMASLYSMLYPEMQGWVNPWSDKVTRDLSLELGKEWAQPWRERRWASRTWVWSSVWWNTKGTCRGRRKRRGEGGRNRERERNNHAPYWSRWSHCSSQLWWTQQNIFLTPSPWLFFSLSPYLRKIAIANPSSCPQDKNLS